MTIIGELLEKHALADGVEELAHEVELAEAELAEIEEQLEAATTDEEKEALEEKRMSAAEKRAAKIRRLRLKKDPSYRKAKDKVAKLNKGLDKPKYSVQRDEETGDWIVDKIDLAAAKRARLAAKKRPK